VSFLLKFQKIGKRGKNSLKILGIDDNESINKMLKNILIPAGHEYQSVTNGRDGLKLIQEQTWDVVLLDVAMPEFSGYDVIFELVKNRSLKKQPVILFTASNVASEDLSHMLQLGVYCCLQKPIDVKNLLEILENVKNRKEGDE